MIVHEDNRMGTIALIHFIAGHELGVLRQSGTQVYELFQVFELVYFRDFKVKMPKYLCSYILLLFL